MIGVAGDFFVELGIIIIIVALAAFLLRLLRQPQILAYVIVGILITPVFGLVTDTSIIESSLRPFFGRLQLEELALEHVDAFRRLRCPNERDFNVSLKERKRRGVVSPKTLHNHLTLLISMLNMAVDLGWVKSRPNIKKPKLPKAGFSYLRTEDDIRKFLLAAQEEKAGVFELYYVATYTGMRAGELLGLKWSSVDLKRRLITVCRSYATTTKTDEIRYVPILDALLPVLREWKLRCPSRTWVFPSEVGTMQLPSARVLQETLKRVRTNSGISYYFRFHDLRHTFASFWMMSGGDLFRLQKVLGHKSAEMTQRYAHLSPHAFEQDYGLLGGGDAILLSPARPDLPVQLHPYRSRPQNP